MRVRLRRASACVVAGALIQATQARAQEVIDLSRAGICERCALAPRLLVRLGDVDGAGIIESHAAHVRFEPRTSTYAVFHVGGTRVLLFDRTGTFIRDVGRGGPGPGELGGIIDAQISDSTLVILDRDGPSLLATSTRNTLLGERRLSVRRGRFRLASDSTIVVASMDRSPAAAGAPLHLVHVRTGEPLRHFGSIGGSSAGARDEGNPLLGWSPSRSRVWRGRLAALDLEEWSLEGRLLRRVTARGDWFPQEVGSRDGPPPRTLETFGIDGQNRLWTITLIPDPSWRAAPRGGQEGYVLSRDMARLFDARIDVYDLSTREHVGTLRWDEAHVGLVQIGEELAVQRVVEDAVTARVEVYRLEPVRRR